MGIALPAELNGYPGPRHVLELADELDLPRISGANRAAFEDMRRKAIDLGEQIVELEAALDELFASGTAERRRAARDDRGARPPQRAAARASP